MIQENYQIHSLSFGLQVLGFRLLSWRPFNWACLTRFHWKIHTFLLIRMLFDTQFPPLSEQYQCVLQYQCQNQYSSVHLLVNNFVQGIIVLLFLSICHSKYGNLCQVLPGFGNVAYRSFSLIIKALYLTRNSGTGDRAETECQAINIPTRNPFHGQTPIPDIINDTLLCFQTGT